MPKVSVVYMGQGKLLDHLLIIDSTHLLIIELVLSKSFRLLKLILNIIEIVNAGP